jgi:hypothetical protein
MMQGQEENFSNIAHLGNTNQNGELTREIHKLQSEKNVEELGYSDKLSDGT